MICCSTEMQVIATAGTPEGIRAVLLRCLECEAHRVDWVIPPGTPAWMNAVQRYMGQLEQRVKAAAYGGPVPIPPPEDLPELVPDGGSELDELQRRATRTGKHYVYIECTTDENGTRRTEPMPFDSREEAEAEIIEAYSVDNPEHMTPAAPGEVVLRRIGEDEWDVSGPLVGVGVIQRVKIVSPEKHEQLRLID